MAFGKKPSGPKPPGAPIMSEANLQALERLDRPKQPQVPADQIRQNIIPAELFDPNTQEGRLLAALGMSLNDASNVVKTDDALTEKTDRERHQMLAFIGQINAGLPDGVNVAPYLMIPEQCWNGPHGRFLFSYLELTPYTSWNMIPLPRDERSSDALDLRAHPGSPPPNTFVEQVDAVIGKISADVDEAGRNFRREMESRGSPNWEQMADIVDQSRRKMRGVAWAITARILNQRTLQRSRELFYGEKFDA